MKWLLGMYLIFASVVVVFIYADELKTMFSLRKVLAAQAPLSVVIVMTRSDDKKDKTARKLERAIKDAYYKVKKTDNYKKLRIPFALVDTRIIPDIVTEYNLPAENPTTISLLFFKRAGLYKQSSVELQKSDDAQKVASAFLKEIQEQVGTVITRLLEEKEEHDYEIEKAQAETRWYSGYSPSFDSWYNGYYYPSFYGWGFGSRHHFHYYW